MKGYYILSKYCELYGLNYSRILNYYKEGLIPNSKLIKEKIYIPEWMYKFQRNIIKNTSKITNIYSAIMKAVNKKIHLNHELCDVTKNDFQNYLEYLEKEDMIKCVDKSNKDLIESYIPTLKLANSQKIDYYKLAQLIIDSAIKVAGVN